MLFAPGAPRKAYFEGFSALADMTDDERQEWFIRHDNYLGAVNVGFSPTAQSRDAPACSSRRG
jgi:hypothetical protein